METIVYQSFRQQRVPDWVETCLASVRTWAEQRRFAYRFFDDEIFQRVPGWYREKTTAYPQIATDLGRLRLAQEPLAEGFERAVWLDADVLVFDPAGLTLDPAADFAFAREIWVQGDGRGGLKAYRNVHNALCLFRRDNAFLDFYAQACERIVGRTEGGLPPQIVDTKLLTALHNIIGFDLVDSVAMASPRVIADIAAGGGPALGRVAREHPGDPAAVNLCASLVGGETDGVRLTEDLLARTVERLRDGRAEVFHRRGA